MYSHIYIDESGEFGYGPNSSDVLVATALLTDHPRRVEKLARKLWKALPHLHVHQELHANESDLRSINKILHAVADEGVKAHAYILTKQPDADIHSQYYRLLAHIIRSHTNAYEIFIDKRDTDKKRKLMISDIEDGHIFDRVKFVDSRAVKQIQIVDFISWAVFQKKEFSISDFTDILGDNLTIEEWRDV